LAPFWFHRRGIRSGTKCPTLDELVAKKLSKPRAVRTRCARCNRLKLPAIAVVNEGQLQLGYTETKKRPDEVRSERRCKE